MSQFIINRLLQSVIVLIVMSGLVFAGLFMIGDPTSMLISPEATQIEQDALRKALGLDQSLWAQYVQFISHVATGDFGRSFLTGDPTITLILQRLPATLELAITAMLFAIAVGVPLGIWAGLTPNSKLSRGVMSGSMLGVSLPNFWIGLMLVMVFSVWLGVLPASGRGPTTSFGPVTLSITSLEGWRHILLPALTLAVGKAALIMRVTRAATREILPMDYIKYARAKGLSRSRILRVHVLKNVAIPVITITGLEFGNVVAFAVVTETVFSWPGMGKLLIDSIIRLDRPVVVTYLMLMVLFLVLLNLLIDVTYALIDPSAREKARS